MTARTDEELVLTLRDRALAGEERASTLVAEAFATRRDLDARRRRAIAEATYGLLRRDALLRLAIDPRPLDERARHHALLALRARLDDPDTRAAALDELAPVLAALPDRVARVAALGSLPDWLARALDAQYGPEAEPLALALAAPPPTDLRVNPLRAHAKGGPARDVLLARLAAEGIAATALPRTSFGVRLAPGAYDLFATAAFRDGLFEVQDEGSQLVAELVAPPPGGLVLDACAGEGGKTLALAALLQGKGRVVACDVSTRKLEVLTRRARRAGLSNVQTIALSPDGALPDAIRALEGRVDRVLVDAPCSGVGAFRRNPEARHHLKSEAIPRLCETQRAILARVRPLVAPGGRLVYATCTVLADENQANAAFAREGDFVTMRPAEIWGKARAGELVDETGDFLTLLPHRHGTDGFCAAVLRRPRA
jgi:16S rRNA (cytosine967-C5)-methyltransferase